MRGNFLKMKKKNYLKHTKKIERKNSRFFILIFLVSYYKNAYLLFTENQDVHALILKSSSNFTITPFNLKLQINMYKATKIISELVKR